MASVIPPQKCFNRVATSFFRELAKIFPTDAKLQFLSSELLRMSSDKTKDRIPGIKFFHNMNSVALDNITVGEMIMTKDDRLFSEDSKVTIPQLEILNFKQKWKVLCDENKCVVWGYLERMAKLSAQVFVTNTVTEQDVALVMSAACTLKK